VGILSENITYLQSSQHNGYGQDVVFELTEIFLKAMADKGLSPSQGLRVFQAVSNVSIAAAIQEWRQQDLYGNSTTVYEAVQSAFKGVEPGKLPNLEIVLEEYASPARVHTDILLITYFEAIASERGEKITNNRGTTAINSSTNNRQM
jgi:hypothetical protein